MVAEEFTAVTISREVRNDYSGPNGTNVCWAWAGEHFGLPGQTYSGFRWQWDTNQTFYFRDKADAVLFALRWS